MPPVTQPLREALMRVKKDPALQPFVEYLYSELAREQTAMMGLDAPMVYRAQGRASCMNDLTKLIESVDGLAALEKSNFSRPMTTAGLF